MNFFIQDAWAQSGSGGTGGLIGLLPLVLMFVIFYFLLIRPQQKKAKEHRNMVADLSKGDEVVTNGGVLGRITGVGENFVTVEVTDGVELRVQRFAIAQMMPQGTIKSNRADKPKKSGKPGKSGKSDKSEQVEQSDDSELPAQSDQ